MKKLFLLLLLTLLLPAPAPAEFYSYEDRSGTVHFVDDPARIPHEYRQKKQVRKDEYDDLPADERSMMLERDRRERDAARRREEEAQSRSRRARRIAEAEAERERQRVALITPVAILGRQVFVPVRLSHGGAETDAMLLLDTGATTSVITPEVAARLKIGETDRVRVGVVGGRVLNAKRLLLSGMRVGPVNRTGQEVVIIRQRAGEMGDGLLGMSFLAGLKYTIDFEKQTLNWIP
ncbi:MAG TPA: retropepsin-like aspartic protease [Geobacteraceae bacterium]|nr:retropepsin-like aspartic protease [Geobacteraceae bacterium]